jgi:tetratricopeptide (TPR) repeat protein
MIALTEDTLWIQGVWQLRTVPLQAFRSIEAQRDGAELTLVFGPDDSAEKMTLTFGSAAERDRWCRELQPRQQVTPDAPQDDSEQPEGVTLVRQAADVPHVNLGPVEFTGQTPWAADRGLQLRAGMRGADAVVGVYRHKSTDATSSHRRVSGMAIRLDDAGDRKRLRLRWFSEQVCALVNRMLLLLVIQMALLLLAAVFCTGAASLMAPTGDTPLQAFVLTGVGMAILFAWPLVVLALLRILRWPQLVRTAGLAVLAATTGRMLALWLAHFLAAGSAGATLARSRLWVLVDPVDWAFLIAGVVLWVRACRLARDACHVLPQEVRAPSTGRLALARGFLAVTGLYALAFLSVAAISRYEESAHLLQPGVDPQREQQALLAFNDGVTQANRGDLGSAEQSWQRSLRLWEGLTAGRSAPPVYRMQLALTVYNLGWLRHRQGQVDEAEKHYARAVALADELAGAPQLDDQFKQTMTEAGRILAELRADRLSRLLDEKDRAGVRKYEEAQLKAQQGAVEAEGLYQEAIALWEEVLPQATSPEYRKTADSRLATTYLFLGVLQQRLGKRARAEASFRKAIDHGEKAVVQEPEQPPARQNLEVARRLLKELSK